MTILKRNCDFCGCYYEGQGVRFCSLSCRSKCINRNRPPRKNNYKFSNCKICKIKFRYHPGSSTGVYCSRLCYQKDTEATIVRNKKAGNITCLIYQKLPDNKLIEGWEKYKTGKYSFSQIFPMYKRLPPKRLTKLIPKSDREKYARVIMTQHQGGYLYRRGVHYERRAMKELQANGYLVVRSSGSHGVFDLWAVNEDHLLLVQCKATKANGSNYTKEKEEMFAIKTPVFCRKELWVWVERKGWNKVVV